MRSLKEIREAFEPRGCMVKVYNLGHSYRAGGEVFIFAPDIDPESLDGFNFVPAEFEGFEGTGYDGRGRHYKVWLVTVGDFIPVTEAVYHNAPENRRIEFGAEHKSASNLRWYVHRSELPKAGLADFVSAFAKLGL